VTVGVVVPAAGAGTRLGGGVPKALRPVGGVPLLVHAVRRLAEAPSVGPVVVVAPAGSVAEVAALVGPAVTVVAGGAERQDSVRLGLAALPPEVDLVLVHDAARAFVPVAVVEAVVAALRGGAAAVVPVVAVADTVKRVADDVVVETVDRAELRAVQTPQGFVRSVLEAAHASDVPVTDDASLVEAMGVKVATVPGSALAFKVTKPVDLALAEAVLRGEARADGQHFEGG
jgi:2-C-methyl-D-erythritol 4-phosphate cytidylyltransferase